MGGKTLTFGISGYLYRSAVLYYDDETETFWEQMSGHAVIGPWTGKRLKWLPLEVMTWDQWKRKHPNTTVLKPVFSAERYAATNRRYAKYRERGRHWAPLNGVRVDPSYKEMERVVIVDRGKGARCYPFKELTEGVTEDGGLKFTRKGDSVAVANADGKFVPHMTGFWFAWCAYYPTGTVYKRTR